METVFQFLLIAVIVTLVGHGIWVLIAKSIAGLVGENRGSKSEPPDRLQDLAAFERILRYLQWQGKISSDERTRLSNLAECEPSSLTHAASSPAPVSPKRHDLPESPSIILATNADEPSLHVVNAATSTPVVPAPTTSPHPLDPTPVLAESIDRPRKPEVSKPQKALGEILQSFLAAKNIRWGELIAGLLIVVCSVGLVISLWSTMQQTHRLLPSLVFLLGTAGVEAAGLYTLRKWNLKDTSRAVLIIATLLVPLNIVAGIALATSEAAAIGLMQPVTLAVIVLATIVYSILLWLSGNAIFGRGSWQLGLAVGGPSFLMPLIPAAVRQFGVEAAWLNLVPATIIGAAIVARMRLWRDKKTHLAGGWRFVLLTGIAVYTLCVESGFLASQLPRTAPVLVKLAFGLLPAVLALMACGSELRNRFATESSNSLRMIANSTIMIAGLIIVALFPATLGDQIHLIAWTAICTGVSIALALVLRVPVMLYVACGASALGMLLVGNNAMMGIAWDQAFPLWRRFLSGESVVVLPILAAVFGMIAMPIRNWHDWHLPVAIMAGITASVGVIVAAAVATGPALWCGSIPFNVVLGILLVDSLLVALAGAWRIPRCVHLAGLGFAAFCLALCRPEAGWLESTQACAWGGANAAGLLLMFMFALAIAWQFLPCIAWIEANDVRLRFCWNWVYAVGLVVASGAIAVIAYSPQTAAWLMAASSIAWISAGIRGKQNEGFVIGQLLGLVASGLAVHAMQPDCFAGRIHWADGTAMWRLVTVVAAYAATWHGIRILAQKAHLKAIESFVGIERTTGQVGSIALIALAFATASITMGTYAIPNFAAEQADWIAGWQRFDTVPVLAIMVAVLVAVLRVIDRGNARFSDTLRSASVMLLLIAHAGVSWLAVTLSPPNFQVAIVASGALSFGIVSSAMIRWATVRKVMFASSIEQELWPINLASLGVVSGTGTTVLAIVGIWQPSIEASLIDPIASWFAPVTAIFGAGLLAIVSVWYRRDGLATVSAVVAVAAVMTSGAAMINSQMLELAAFLQLLGIGCFAMVIAQRAYQHTGVIRVVEKWQIAEVSKAPMSAEARGGFWPSAWPVAVQQLASVGSAVVLIVSIVGATSIGMEMSRLANFTSGAYGGRLGMALLAMAAAIWTARADKAHLIADASAWMILAAPTAADGWKFWQASTGFTTWSIMLGACAVATMLATIVSFVVQKRASRAASVALLGSSLLIGSGWLSFIAGAAELHIWLVTWSVGTLVGLAITLQRGTVHRVRTLSGIPILSGILVILAVTRHEPSTWIQVLGSNDHFAMFLLVVAWMLLCGVLWRLRFAVFKRSVAPVELPKFKIDSVVLLAGTILFASATPELASTFLDHGVGTLDRFGIAPLLVLLCGLLAIVVSTIRWDSKGQLSAGYIMTACASITLVMFTASNGNDDPARFYPIVGITLGLLTALTAWMWPLHLGLRRLFASKGIAWRAGSEDAMRFELSGWFVATLIVTLLGTFVWIIGESDLTGRWVWIAAIVACGISIGQIGSNMQSGGLRTLSVMALCVAAMFGSVADVRSVDLGRARELAQVMRLFIASVWLIPLVAWAAPRILTLDTQRWGAPIRRGAMLSACVAASTLTAIFSIEFSIRTEGIGIPELPTILVIGTSVVIAIFSLLALGIAMFPGKFLTSSVDRLTVTHRQLLVYAAQILMLLAVVNKFMCQPSTLGLREYWPYIVMALAFVSAGLSTWAQRRGDALLLGPLRNSALYLPLIPIVGFWLTSGGEDWIFAGGRVNYSLVLVIAAVFYLALSALWPGDRMSRVAGIIAANAALWVTLTQNPGWGFLQHPQLWLIPPAACVLAAVHLEKHRLQPKIVTACRYAATLVVYISSTADMIVQQIGANIYGPIILILLAFAGVAAGIILHVRAFLYLGTGFIVVGLISMVWHAGAAIDQVWPWWAFGITMGLILLAGLMAIEKNKDALRGVAKRLNQWEA